MKKVRLKAQNGHAYLSKCPLELGYITLTATPPCQAQLLLTSWMHTSFSWQQTGYCPAIASLELGEIVWPEITELASSLSHNLNTGSAGF